MPVPQDAAAADLSSPFDISGDPKLSEEELGYVLSGGSRTLDGKNIREGEGLLTLGGLLPLLQETSAAGVKELKKRKAEGGLTTEDWKEALRLLWERRLLLNKDDIAFLESLLKRAYGKVPAKKEKGAAQGRAGAGKAALAKVSGTAGTPQDELYVKLLDKLLLEDRGKPEELKALKETVAKMLQSSTAREIAAQFVATGAQVRVTYAKMEGSTLTEERGKKEFTGAGGLTYTGRQPILVELNEFYMQTSPDRVENASILAHELLGHAFRSVQSKAKGLDKVMNRYADDETNSRLLGWITQAELGGKLDSALSWSYMKDPAQYYASLGTAHAYYAQTFTRKGMEDPVKVLEGRLAKIEEYVKSYQGWRGRLEDDRKAIAHFTSDPGHMKKDPPSTFNMVKIETDNRLDHYIPEWLTKWEDMGKKVQANIDYYKSPAGQADMAALQAAAQDPFFQGLDAEIVRLTKILKKSSQGRDEGAETAPPPPTPGQITREKLHEKIKEDRAQHPEHWK